MKSKSKTANVHRNLSVSVHPNGGILPNRHSFVIRDGNLRILIESDGIETVTASIAKRRANVPTLVAMGFISKKDQLAAYCGNQIPRDSLPVGVANLKYPDIFNIGVGIRIAARNLRHALKGEMGTTIAKLKKSMYGLAMSGKFMGPKETK